MHATLFAPIWHRRCTGPGCGHHATASYEVRGVRQRIPSPPKTYDRCPHCHHAYGPWTPGDAPTKETR